MTPIPDNKHTPSKKRKTHNHTVHKKNKRSDESKLKKRLRRSFKKTRRSDRAVTEHLHGEMVSVSAQVVVGKSAKFNPNELGRWKFIDFRTSVAGSTTANYATANPDGLQGVNYCGFYCLASHFNQASQSSVVSGRLYSSLTLVNGLINLNPYQNSTGGLATGNTSRTYSDDTIVLERIRCKYGFYNATTVIPIKFEFYAVTPRTAIANTISGNITGFPIDAWSQNLANAGQGYATAVPEGPATAATWGGLTDIHTIGQRPEMNRQWNKQYKILNKKSFTLESGASVEYNIDFEYNKKFDKQTMATMTAANTIGIPNKSVMCFVISQGGMCYTAMDKTFTYAGHELGIMNEVEYICKTPMNAANRTQTATINPVLVSGGTFNTEDKGINVVDVPIAMTLG